MDEVEENGNSNNIVALNIAREMVARNPESNTSEDVEGMSTCFGNIQINKNTTTERNIQDPNFARSDTSCESRESGLSFTGNPENCEQFVEVNRFQSNETPMSPFYNRAPPYFIYNGQMYSSFSYYPYPSQTSLSAYSYADGQCQNVPYFQINSGNQVYNQPTNTKPPFQPLNGTDNRDESADGEEKQLGECQPNVIGKTDLQNTVKGELQKQLQLGDHQDSNRINVSPREEAQEEGATNFIPTQIYYNKRHYHQAPQTEYLLQHTQVNEQSHNIRQPSIDYHQYHENVLQMFHQQAADKKKFQYPAIYVSTTGLITVLMKHDVSVETTVEQAIRLVSHQQKLVGAINNRGNASYLYHPAAHVMQDSTTTETDIFLGRKVKMTTDYISFANNFKCYKFDYNKIDESSPDFSDLSKDQSVNFLFTENQSNPDILNQCTDIISRAEYEKNADKGGMCIRINGFKIIQTNKGDVIVKTRNKFLRMSPTTSILRLGTNFVQMDIEMNWNVRIRRGAHTVNASHLGIVVSNGKVEAAFDESHRVHACVLPSRRPLLIGGDTKRRCSRDKSSDRDSP